MKNKQKICILDEGVLSSRSICNWGSVELKKIQGKIPYSTFNPPPSYTWFATALGSLKRIGITKDDIVIVARDKTKSWRKFFYENYKAQRWEQRDAQSHIDWRKQYQAIDGLMDQIQESTNWNVLWYPNFWNGADLLFSPDGEKLIDEAKLDPECLGKWYSVEADDWIAGASKYYSDHEVVFVSIDCDLDQLCVRPNTKYFNLMIKYKGGRGIYKKVDNGYKVLANKIEKGDKSDNILPGVTDDNTPHAVKLREFIIDLINLPSFVEEKIFPIFENLPKKEIHYDKLPFQNSLAKKFDDIYKKDKIITFEESMRYYENKKKRTAKKAKENRERKKKEKLSMKQGEK